MAPQRRNMTRRKPVPQLSPATSTVSPLTATRGGPLSIMNKEELPPLPNEAREMMECTSVDDRRHAIYLPDSLPPAPPPKDESVAGSRPESLAATLVDGMEVRGDTTSAVPPPLEAQRERVERALPQPSPEVRQKASQKSLPKIFRPPTPPIPAQRPKLRSGGHSATSSQDGHTHIIHLGLTSPERQSRAAPAPNPPTSWPSGLAPDVSVTAHSPGSRSNVLSFAGKDLPPVLGGVVPPHVRRQSAASASTANRASSRRSQFTCQSMCSGVWYALKRLGVHLRVKVGNQGKY